VASPPPLIKKQKKYLKNLSMLIEIKEIKPNTLDRYLVIYCNFYSTFYSTFYGLKSLENPFVHPCWI